MLPVVPHALSSTEKDARNILPVVMTPYMIRADIYGSWLSTRMCRRNHPACTKGRAQLPRPEHVHHDMMRVLGQAHPHYATHADDHMIHADIYWGVLSRLRQLIQWGQLSTRMALPMTQMLPTIQHTKRSLGNMLPVVSYVMSSTGNMLPVMDIPYTVSVMYIPGKDIHNVHPAPPYGMHIMPTFDVHCMRTRVSLEGQWTLRMPTVVLI